MNKKKKKGRKDEKRMKKGRKEDIKEGENGQKHQFRN